MEHLTNRGYIPRFHWLDNEPLAIINKYNRSKYIEYQLVPPHIHRVNSAERAIRTWKDHFIAGLEIIDTCYPMHLWCRLIPQAKMALNMLIPCRRNPTMSEHTAIEGQFEFKKIPLTTPGIKVVV